MPGSHREIQEKHSHPRKGTEPRTGADRGGRPSGHWLLPPKPLASKQAREIDRLAYAGQHLSERGLQRCKSKFDEWPERGGRQL